MMKVVMWIYSLMLLATSVSAMAQGRLASRAEVDSIMNPSLLEGERALCFDAATINIGRLSEDDKPVTSRFYFCKASKETIILTRVLPSVVSIVATVLSATLPVNESLSPFSKKRV